MKLKTDDGNRDDPLRLDRQVFNTHVRDRLGSMELKDVKPSDITSLRAAAAKVRVEKLPEKVEQGRRRKGKRRIGGPAAAARAVDMVRQIFRHGNEFHSLKLDDPTRPLLRRRGKKSRAKKAEPRQRRFAAEEMRKIGKALRDPANSDADISELMAQALLLCAFTLQRCGEVIGMTDDEIDGDVWRLPGERAKNGKPHEIPLSPQALAVIAKARERRTPVRGKNSRPIFASPQDKDAATPMERHSISRAMNRLCKALEIKDGRTHDLRRTGAHVAAHLCGHRRRDCAARRDGHGGIGRLDDEARQALPNGRFLVTIDRDGFSERALLPWESEVEFETLRQAFTAEYAPEGPTERALVGRLIWIEWRRNRLRLAERAAHMVGLAERLDDPQRTLSRAGVRSRTARERVDLVELVASEPSADGKLCDQHAADRKATARALAILDRGGANAYARALAALHPDTRAWWEDGLAGEYGNERTWTTDADCIAAFLREKVAPVDEADAAADKLRPAIRLQAFGESLDPVRIERLLAIDARLDRQFEKALSALIQLRELCSRRPHPSKTEDQAALALACG
jgi:integrase